MCVQWTAMVSANTVNYSWGSYYVLILVLFWLVFRVLAQLKLTARARHAEKYGEH